MLGKMKVTPSKIFWKSQRCKQGYNPRRWKKLQDSYDNVTQEVFGKMIRDVEEYFTNPWPKDDWNLINKITGTTSSKQCIIKAKQKKDRISRWYVRFKNLQRIEPVVEGSPKEHIKSILNNSMISCGPATKEEYTKVKN